VLVRGGQTEGIVDLARMCGRGPPGVICEIMNEDGTMARMPELEKFAQKHGLKICTIADMIAWRRQNERLIEPIEMDVPLPTRATAPSWPICSAPTWTARSTSR
jgi:3,4-dihydroxy 2-butanone 4-phosphate synthase/GTP cyclohydrolase II